MLAPDSDGFARSGVTSFPRSRRALIIAAIALFVTIAACDSPAPKFSPPDDRPLPDACEMLDRAVAQVDGFRELQETAGDSDNCTRDEECLPDDQCADDEANIRRQVRLDLLGGEFDNGVLSGGSKIRRSTVGGRTSGSWARNNPGGSWNCNVTLRISEFRSALVTIIEQAPAEPDCAKVLNLAEKVEPQLPPELP